MAGVVLDDATYIYHQGQVSFSAEVEARDVAEHLQTLDRLHPEYMRLVGAFFQPNPLRPWHEAIQMALLRETPPVMHAGSGANQEQS